MKENNYQDWVLDKVTNAKVVKAIHEQYKEEFDFLYKLNDELIKLEILLDSRVNKEGAEAFILANFITVHKTFQAVVLLLESGLQDDAIALLRGIFERIVNIKCAMDENIYPIIMLNGVAEKLQKIKSVRKQDTETANVENSMLDDMESQLEIEKEKLLGVIHNIAKIKDKKGKYSLRDLAVFADMEQYHNYMYPVLCSKVHSDLSDIMLKICENQYGAYIDAYPKADNNHYYTQSIADLIVILIESIYSFFGIKGDIPLKLYEEEKNIWSDL